MNEPRRRAVLLVLLVFVACSGHQPAPLTLYPWVPPSNRDTQEPPAGTVEQRPSFVEGSCRIPDELHEGAPGSITFWFTIGTDGRLQGDSVGIVSATDTTHVRRAAQMLRTCRFEPGRINGQLVATAVQLPVNYGQPLPATASTSGDAVILNARAERGHCGAVYPDSLRNAGVVGTVLLQFRIDSVGHADSSTIQVIRPANQLLVPHAIAAVMACNFGPGHAAQVQMPVAFGIAGRVWPN